MKPKTLILLALALPLPAQADYALEGRVFLKGSRDPVAGVNLVLLPQKLKVTSGVDGRFRFESVPGETGTLVINAQGFKRFESEVNLAEENEARVLLEPDQSLNFETTIESSEERDQVKKTLSRKAAAAMPGAGSDPIRAVQNLPGVNRAQGFTSQVIIQGSSPQDTRYTIDGHEIPLIFHFGGLSSVFNPELTESFDYLSAGYQSNYGRALGGVLNLNSRDVDAPRLKGSVFLDTFNSGAEIETPLGDGGALAIGVRASYVGQVLKAAFKDNPDFNLTVAPSYNDLSILYSKPLSPNLRFKLLAIGSKDSLEFVANNALGSDPALRGNFSNRIGFFRLIPEFEWTHSARSKTRFSFGLGRDFINSDIGSVYFNLRTIQGTFRAENRTVESEKLTWIYGMDHRFTWADVSFKFPVFTGDGGIFNPLSTADTRVADLKGVPSHVLGFYLNPVYKPGASSPWTFHPGLRLDWFTPVSQALIQPRLGARYSMDSSLALVAAGGLYVQPPEERQYSAEYGNPAIRSPEVWQLKLGAEKDLSEALTKGSEAYSGFYGRSFQNLILTDVSKNYSNQGSGLAYGWENSFKYNTGPWNFWGSYTLSRSTRTDPKNGTYLYQYDQTHFLTLIAGVNLPRNWRISSRFRYVTGPLDTIPIGAAGDLDHDVFVPIRGSLFTARLDAFTMLDLRIDKRWLYDSWTLSLYLDIQNVLNHQNTEGLQYTYDYTSSEPVKGFPILPTFGLKGEF